MNFLRNTLGVIVGLAVAGLIISVGVRINPDWMTYEKFSPFQNWEKFNGNVQIKYVDEYGRIYTQGFRMPN